MLLDYATRIYLRRERSRILKAKQPKLPRLERGELAEDLDGHARPWFPVLHIPSAAHRNLPTLDDYEDAA